MGIWWHYHSNQQANFGTWNPCLVVHPTYWLKNWIYSGIYNKHEDILQYGDWLKLLRGLSTHNSWLFWWEQKGIRANNTKLWWNMVDCVWFLHFAGGKDGGVSNLGGDWYSQIFQKKTFIWDSYELSGYLQAYCMVKPTSFRFFIGEVHRYVGQASINHSQLRNSYRSSPHGWNLITVNHMDSTFYGFHPNVYRANSASIHISIHFYDSKSLVKCFNIFFPLKRFKIPIHPA